MVGWHSTWSSRRHISVGVCCIGHNALAYQHIWSAILDWLTNPFEDNGSHNNVLNLLQFQKWNCNNHTNWETGAL